MTTSKPFFAGTIDLTDKPILSTQQNPEPLSVTEISYAIKGMVERQFSTVRVRGEISGFKRAGSGHLYFALKDEESVIDAICWRDVASRLAVIPEDGLEVICTGKVTTYPGRSKYQIVVEGMEPAGEGALLKLLEERRKKLAAEGLFNPERKKKIPYLPNVIGVITSPTGAVIRDILHRLNDRFPRYVLLWPSLMQGDGAAQQVANGIKGFNAIPAEGLDTPSGHIPRPDVLIVARGGGSLEDLWPFNEEIVVRAAADSEIPLISAVGHETDTTLIDYASDLRAPTPTGAAEKAVPVRFELQETLAEYQTRLIKASNRFITEQQNILTGLGRGIPSLSKMIEEYTQRLDDRSERLNNALKVLAQRKQADLNQVRLNAPDLLFSKAQNDLFKAAYPLDGLIKTTLNDAENKCATAARLLESFSYERILDRGFALVLDTTGKSVSSAQQAKIKSALTLKFSDGSVKVSTDQTVKTKKKKPNDNPLQGTLL